MTCTTCDGSGILWPLVDGVRAKAIERPPCPECSASAMRAQRDEARARVAFEGTATAIAERDAARTALAALLDALPRCESRLGDSRCEERATLDAGKDWSRYFCDEHGKYKNSSTTPQWDTAAEAAERELGRRT